MEFSKSFLMDLVGTKIKLSEYDNKELDFILPESYSRKDLVVKALGNAPNYCYKLLRNIDAHLKISEGIGKSVRFDDIELDYTIWSIAKNQFGASSVAESGTIQKCRLA